ncbi:MAG: hypothetical protein ACYCY7_13915, partial [Gallionella sp.]
AIHQTVYSAGRSGQAEQRRHSQHFAGTLHTHEQPEVPDLKSPAMDVECVFSFNKQASCNFGINLRL